MKNLYTVSSFLSLNQEFEEISKVTFDENCFKNSFHLLEKSLFQINHAVHLLKTDYKAHMQICSDEIVKEGKSMQMVVREIVELAAITFANPFHN
jgi:hypothetical protein